MDLSSLEIFRAVAHETSVTRAAQRLQRAQSN
ncbi:LysR family transcriptional regulator, partial [Klebsiella pneumoniae]